MIRGQTLRALLTLSLFAGCAAPAAGPTAGAGGGKGDALDLPPDSEELGTLIGEGGNWTTEGRRDASGTANFFEFTFEPTIRANNEFSVGRAIESQLLYTVGELNGDNSIGRLDDVQVQRISTKRLEDGVEVKYRAKMLVAWAKRGELAPPNMKYTFHMPIDMRYRWVNDQGVGSQKEFAEKYHGDCGDPHGHDIDENTFWYYYRPNRRQCRLTNGTDDDAPALAPAVETTQIDPSPAQTTGKYPEYHKIWDDGVLNIVTIWGKYEDDATSDWDGGISAYNRFVSGIRSHLGSLDTNSLTTVPENLTGDPGADTPHVKLDAQLTNGKKIHVEARLVDNVRHALGRSDFRDWYRGVSPEADFIAYNGHAGLGANIRAMGREGAWQAGQYVIVFMNGCDTYAYVDSEIWDKHSQVNNNEPGTKYADLVMNAMPSYFRSMAGASLALIKGLTLYGVEGAESAKTYEDVFSGVDRSQVILVSGEQDNVYDPATDGPGDPDRPTDPVEPGEWSMNVTGSVGSDNEWSHHATGELPAGRYTFKLNPVEESSGADADLYVQIGEAPTRDDYACRSWSSTSKEACEGDQAIELTEPGVIHVAVRAYRGEISYELVGARLND